MKVLWTILYGIALIAIAVVAGMMGAIGLTFKLVATGIAAFIALGVAYRKVFNNKKK